MQIIPSPEIKIAQGRKLLTQWLAVPLVHQLGFLMSYALSWPPKRQKQRPTILQFFLKSFQNKSRLGCQTVQVICTNFYCII